MLALLATLAYSAFPVRGSLWRSLDSSFVVDKDTLRLAQACIAGTCFSCQFGTLESANGLKISAFPWTPYRPSGALANVVWDNKAVIDQPPGSTVCTPGASLSTEANRRFVLHGRGDWAVWLDSLQFKVTNGKLTNLLGRWRWSRIDSTAPWVRWIDTLYLGRPAISPASIPPLLSQPVLTTTRSVQVDSLALGWSSCGSGLFLGSDSIGTPAWGYSSRQCATGEKIRDPILPLEPIPTGRTFRALDAYNSGSTALWRLRVDGKQIDSLWMMGTASANVLRRGSILPRTGTAIRTGLSGYEPATGRRVRLDAPLPTGRHILSNQEGTRLILVE